MFFRSFVRRAVILATLAVASPVFASADTPLAPNGFAWREFGFMKVLVPAGWFVKTEETRNAKAVFISKESIDKEGKYSTGFSAKALRNIPQLENMKPSEYAKVFVGGMTKNRLGEVQLIDQPPLKGYQAMVRTKMPSGDSSVLFTSIVGNDDSGTVFVYVFESPETSWPETGKVGQVILKSIDTDLKY